MTTPAPPTGRPWKGWLSGRVAVGIAGSVFVAALIGLMWGRVDLAALHSMARALPPLPVLGAMAVLPLVGFPVSWLHVVAGARFGWLGGLAAVAVTTVIQHWLGWALVRLLPASVFARLAPWRRHLEGAGHRDATLLCGLLPGLPYTAQVYLLPLIGTPFRYLLGLTTVLHTARAVVTLLLGDLSGALTTGRVVLLASYYLGLFAASAVALAHLQRSLRRKADDSARGSE